jgi:membrane-associated phospholipid phosphatase
MRISVPVPRDDPDRDFVAVGRWAGVDPRGPDGHPALVPFLQPEPDSWAQRWVRHRDDHPAWAIAGSFVVAWAVLSTVFVTTGLLLTKVVLGGARGSWDESVNRWLADHRTAWLSSVTSVATFLANTLPVVLLLATVCAILLVVRRWREAVFLVGALTFELTVFLTTNFLVDRSRPDVPRLDSTPSTGSYPSGHIAATLALWCGTALVVSGIVRSRVVRIAVWVVALTATVLVGFARVYRGMHHVTDVTAGAALGVGALIASAFVVRVVTVVVDRRRSAAPSPVEVHS